MSEQHLQQFNGQCSVLLSEEKYVNFMEGREQIGYDPTSNDPRGSMFVSTSADIDKALNECNGDISKLEESLGLPQGHFGEGPIVRVDISNPEEHGLRMATGTEPGANEFYNTPLDENGNLPNIQYADSNHRVVDTDKTDPTELVKLNGQYWDQNGQYHAPNPEGYNGKTSGGLDEAVINRVPNTAENVTYTKIDGFKRGEEGNLSTSNISDGYATTPSTKSINSQNVTSETGGGARAPTNTSGELPPQQDLKTETSPEKSGVLPKEETSNNCIDSQKSGTPPDKSETFDALNNAGKADAVVDTGKDIGNSATTGVATGIV